MCHHVPATQYASMQHHINPPKVARNINNSIWGLKDEIKFLNPFKALKNKADKQTL